MYRIKQILRIILAILIPYLFLIYFYPIVWISIDNYLWIKINSKIIEKMDSWIGDIKWSEESINNFIDWVWNNTKNKRQKQLDNINNIQNQ